MTARRTRLTRAEREQFCAALQRGTGWESWCAELVREAPVVGAGDLE